MSYPPLSFVNCGRHPGPTGTTRDLNHARYFSVILNYNTKTNASSFFFFFRSSPDLLHILHGRSGVFVGRSFGYGANVKKSKRL